MEKKKVLLDVAPKKGGKVRVIWRQGSQSGVDKVAIPSVLYSYMMPTKELKEAFDDLEKMGFGQSGQSTYELHQLEKSPLGSLELRAAPELIKFAARNLTKYFPSDFNLTELLRNDLGMPYAEMKGSQFQPQSSLKDFVDYLSSQWMVTLDIELDWKGTGKTTVACLHDGTSSFIYTTYNIAPIDGAEVIRCSSDSELEALVGRKIQELDPLIVNGYNLMNYDLRKLSTGKKGKRNFKPGIGDAEPAVFATIDIFKGVKIDGRIVIDPYGFARNYCVLARKNLESVAKHFGIHYTKKFSTPELADAMAKARNGDEAAATQIVKYCLEDTVVTHELGKATLPSMAAASYLFKRTLESVCITSKRSMAAGVDRLEKVSRTHSIKVESQDARQEYDDFDMYELQRQYLERDYKRVTSHELGTQRGVFSGRLLYAIPYMNAFKELFCLDQKKRSWEVYRAMPGSGWPRQLCMSALTAFAEPALFRIVKLMEANLRGSKDLSKGEEAKRRADGLEGYPEGLEGDKSFVFDYGLPPGQFASKLAFDFTRAAEQLQDLDVYNHSSRFFVVGSDKELNLDEFLDLGPVEMISGTAGRMILLQGKDVVSQGIDATGRLGYRTKFEQELYAGICQNVLVNQDAKQALRYVGKRSRDLAEGNVAKEDLLGIAEEAKRDSTDYSYPSFANLERVRLARKENIAKGQRFGWGYVNGKLVPIDKFLAEGVKPDLDIYMKKIFGEETEAGRSFTSGTVSDLVYSVFPVRAREQRTCLANVLSGAGSDDDISCLMKWHDESARQLELKF